MNTQQKLRYTALGAVIMLVGMCVGSIVSPSLIAQHNDVFDTITCQGIRVVNKAGKGKILLGVFEDGAGISILDKDGNSGISLETQKSGNGVWVKRAGNMGVGLIASEAETRLRIYDKAEKHAIGLGTDEYANYLFIEDSAGKRSFEVEASVHRNRLGVFDKSSGEGIGFYADADEAKRIRWDPPKEGK